MRYAGHSAVLGQQPRELEETPNQLSFEAKRCDRPLYKMEKCFAALEIVDLHAKQNERKLPKNRALGDIERKNYFQPPRSAPAIVRSLVDLEFMESRAINDKTPTSIICEQQMQIDNAYKRVTKRISNSLSSKCDSPISFKNQNKSGKHLSNKDKNNFRKPSNGPGNPNLSRPHTAVVKFQPKNFATFRCKSAGTTVSMEKTQRKKNFVKDLNLYEFTKNVLQNWEKERNVSSVSSESAKTRVKSTGLSESVDPSSTQWYSFAPNSIDSKGGVINTFTGNMTELHRDYYNIEGNTGSKVAQQLKTGNKVRVCINGQLQSSSMKIKPWRQLKLSNKKFELQFDDISPYEEKFTRPPISWTDQVSRSTAKIISPTISKCSISPMDLCEQHPVKFKKLINDNKQPTTTMLINEGSYQIRSRDKKKMNIDATESLNNRITVLTVDHLQPINSIPETVSTYYNDILKKKMIIKDDNKTLPTQYDNEKHLSNKYLDNSKESLPHTGSSISIESISKEYLVDRYLTPRASFVSSSTADMDFITAGINPSPCKGGKISTSFSTGIAPDYAQLSQGNISSSSSSSKHTNKQQYEGLSKPGQLYRTGHASISAKKTMENCESSYIQISQAIKAPPTALATQNSHQILNNEKINVGENMKRAVTTNDIAMYDHMETNNYCKGQIYKVAIPPTSPALNNSEDNIDNSTILNVCVPTAVPSVTTESDLHSASDLEITSSIISFTHLPETITEENRVTYNK